MRPSWLNSYDWSWAQIGELSKLLGTPFGLELDTKNVDDFLVEKITKKLKYWSTTRLSLAGRTLIVNQVLLSTLYYFLAVWAGTVRSLRKIKTLLRCYLWAGNIHATRTRVAWSVCCVKKGDGGLGLVEPEDAMDALLIKWVMLAVTSGDSNLQYMLRFRLA